MAARIITLEKTEKSMYITKTAGGYIMDNHLFGFIAATILFCYVLGWKGLFIALLFLFYAWGQSKVPQKKKSKLLSWFEKLGE